MIVVGPHEYAKYAAKKVVAAHQYQFPGDQKMKRKEILAKFKSGEIDDAKADELLEQLDQKKRGTLYCKVSQKGGMSLYGLQRMPVTLYVEQWERLLDFSDEICQFLKEHDSELKRKER